MANFLDRYQSSAVNLYAKWLKVKKRMANAISWEEVFTFLGAVLLTWVLYSSHYFLGYFLIALIIALIAVGISCYTMIRDNEITPSPALLGQFICSILLGLLILGGVIGQQSALSVLIIVFLALCTKITTTTKYFALYLAATSLTILFTRYAETGQIFLVSFLCTLFTVLYTLIVYFTLWVRSKMQKSTQEKPDNDETDT